ncbi:MAG: DUF4363 family protein [Oscillospiraceae bacterium]|jgi:hypothetical protein|nr:DUF4363 family protein [Oscillospiraceae bacterium]MDD3261890.1 DUF4363 family protein [Oscillospiraceae bacterium]
MKRMAIAAAIFITAIFLCFAGSHTTKVLTESLAGTLDKAQQAAQANDAKSAYAFSSKACSDWQKSHQILCTFQPHSRLEAIDQTLATLPDLSRCDNLGQFESECARGKTLAENLRESELPLLQNIL